MKQAQVLKILKEHKEHKVFKILRSSNPDWQPDKMFGFKLC